MKRTILAAMAVVAMLGIAGFAGAAPGDHDGPMHGQGRGYDRPMHGPRHGVWHGYGPGYDGLTAEQQADLQTLDREHEAKVAPLRRQMDAKRAELDAIYYGPGADAAKVQQLFREMADIKARLFLERFAYRDRLASKGIHEGMGPRCRGGHGPRW